MPLKAKLKVSNSSFNANKRLEAKKEKAGLFKEEVKEESGGPVAVETGQIEPRIQYFDILRYIPYLP